MELSPIALALLNGATDTRLPMNKSGIGGTLSNMMLQQAQTQNQQVSADAERYKLNEEQRTQQMLRGMDLTDPTLAQKLLAAGEPALAAQVVKLQARPTATSTIGKIQADIDAGLIDPATGAAALKKATTIAPVFDPVSGNMIYAGGNGFAAPQDAGMQEPIEFPAGVAGNRRLEQDYIKDTQTTKIKETSDRKKTAIPGYDILEDIVIDPATARASRELNSAIPTYENAIKKINDLIDKEGSTIGAGTDVNAVEGAMSDLMNAERAVNNTGVLNVGEIPILQQLYSTFDPRNPMNLSKSKEEMKAAALSYLADRKGLIQGKLKSIGYIPKASKEDASDAPINLEAIPLDALDAAIARKLGGQ